MLEYAVFNSKTQGFLGVVEWERFGQKRKTDPDNTMSGIWGFHIGSQDSE